MNPTQKRNLVLYMAGRLISLVGSGVQAIAMPLYILDLTGSGTLMGTFAMLGMVPALLVSPLAGVLGDRLNRKHIAVLTDYGRGAIIFILCWLASAGRMSVAALFAGQALVSVLDSFFSSATMAMLPDLTDPEDYSRANATRNAVDSLSMIAGPILGGIVYSFWGIRMVFFLNAASFVISALCESLILYAPGAVNAARLTGRSFFGEIKETLSFIRHRTGLKQLSIFAMLGNALAMPVFVVAIPFMFKKVIGFSAEQYGYLMTTFTAGVLLGNVILGSVLAKADTGRMLRTGLVVQGSLFVVMIILMFPAAVKILAGPGWVYFGVIAACFVTTGFFNALVNTPLNTNLQRMVPAAMRSRFFAVLGLMAQLAVPLGTGFYGVLLERRPFRKIQPNGIQLDLP